MPADDPSPATPAAPPAGDGGDAPLHLGCVVAIDNFSGPLDLLLFLVRRTELDIIDIPILLIIDQFVAAVGGWQDPDLETAGDFILMAATLLEIKARAIAPPVDGDEPVGEDDAIFDPRSTLISSLLRYRRFKEAARLLELLGEARAPCLVRQLHEIVPEDAPDESDLDLSAVDAHCLLRTYESILLRLNGLGPRTVLVDDIPMAVRIERLIDALRERSVASLAALLGQAPSRMTQVAMVLAVLEGTRQGLVAVGQERQYGEITLRLREAEDSVAALPPVTEEEEPKRRRRLPLVTYQAPPTADDGGEPPPEEEEAESDEQRFLRELEEASQVDALLAGVSDLDASFAAYCARHHPELLPPPAVAAALGAAAGATGNGADQAAGAIAPSTPAAADQPRPAVPVAAPAPPAAPAMASATPAAQELPIAGEHGAVAPAAGARGADAAPGPAVERGPAPAAADALAAQRDDAPVDVAPVPSAGALADTGVAADADAGEPAGTAPGAAPASGPVIAGQDAAALPPAPTATLAALAPPSGHPDLHGPPADRSGDTAAGTTAGAMPAPPESGASGEAPALPTASGDAPAGATVTSDAPAEGSGSGLPGAPPAGADLARAPGHPLIVAQAADQPHAAADEATPPPAISLALAHGEADRAEPPPVPGLPQDSIAPQDGSAFLEMPAAEAAPAASSRWDQPADPLGQDDRPDGEPDLVSGAAQVEPSDAGKPYPPDDAAAESAPSGPATPSPDVAEMATTAVPLPGLPAAAPVSGQAAVAAAAADGGRLAHPADDAQRHPSPPEALAGAMAGAEMPPPTDPAGEPASPVCAAAPAVVTAPPEPAWALVDERCQDARPVDPRHAAASSSAPPPLLAPPGHAQGARAVPLTTDDPAQEPPSLRLPDPEPEPEPEREPEPPGGPPPRSHRRPSRLASATATTPTTLPKARSAMTPPPQRRTRIIAALVAINVAWLAYAWLSWVPRDLLEVVAMPPAQVEGHEPLRFAFNLDMVGDAMIGRPPAAKPEITPTIAGSWSWHDARTLEFIPQADLPAASAFNILLARDALRADSGLRLGHDVRLAVRTPGLRLQGARLESFAPGGRAIVILDFNQPVDPALIARTLAIADAAEAAAQPPPAAPRVTALDAAPSARIRLQIESGGRFELAAAQLTLPGGTCGIAGPLGLAVPWRARMDLGHVLAVRTLSADAPPRGDVTIHLATTTADAPAGLLAAALTVQPPVPFTVHATGQGLDLVGAFLPGEAYRIAVDERWPEAIPLHPLAAYPAGGSWQLAIPARRAGLWLDGAAAGDGRFMLGAQAVERASVEVLPRGEEQPLITGAVVFQVAGDGGQGNAALDTDQLLAALPNGLYRLRVRAGDAPQRMAETELAIEEIALRPGDLAMAVARWCVQGLGGSSGSDVSARRVRFAH